MNRFTEPSRYGKVFLTIIKAHGEGAPFSPKLKSASNLLFTPVVFSVLEILEREFSRFRLCVACGQFIGHPAKMPEHLPFLCVGCHKILEDNKVKSFVSGYSNKTLSVFEWNERNDRLVRKLVMALKGGGAEAVFYYLATRIVKMRLECRAEWLRVPFCFVPAPRRPGTKKRDHAEELAFQLAKITGGEFLPVLKRARLDQQKQLNERQRRWSGRLALDERRDYIERLHMAQKTKCIIFVDDVVTSGGTAISAFEILSAPKLFEVWTIFFRPRLRAGREFDITHCK